MEISRANVIPPAFGGDKDRVTISGESAGSISVYDHLLINSGDNCYHGRPLFRGAIMDSGSLVPATDVSSAKPQGIYDTVVRAGGCANAPSTLDCLRDLPYEVYKAAADSVPPYTSAQGVDLSYRTRPDPNNPFYPVSGDVATRRGDFAKVPAIIGDQEDEGTIFALALSNVTTTDALVKYVSTRILLMISKLRLIITIVNHILPPSFKARCPRLGEHLPTKPRGRIPIPDRLIKRGISTVQTQCSSHRRSSVHHESPICTVNDHIPRTSHSLVVIPVHLWLRHSIRRNGARV
jgi:hypothetical protein